MINTHYSLTNKEYKKSYIQVMTISYMKIYVIVLLLGIAITGLLSLIFKSARLQSTSLSLLVTFIPTLCFCLGLSIFVSYLDLKKVVKKHPETMEGNFRIRFDKSFIIWQINGVNNKVNYTDYHIRKGFNNTVVISNVDNYNIVIPANILTKDQYKKIKSYIRG